MRLSNCYQNINEVIVIIKLMWVESNNEGINGYKSPKPIIMVYRAFVQT